jgi:2Fe-2S ferredoxin
MWIKGDAAVTIIVRLTPHVRRNAPEATDAPDRRHSERRQAPDRVAAAAGQRAGRERMARITYLENDGGEQSVEVPVGLSVMDAAKRHAIAGVEGDCGGACACATCHVYVEDGWFERLPPMEELEQAMLDFAFEVQPNSRLACQIKVDASLDGLIVRCPSRQY